MKEAGVGTSPTPNPYLRDTETRLQASHNLLETPVNVSNGDLSMSVGRDIPWSAAAANGGGVGGVDVGDTGVGGVGVGGIGGGGVGGGGGGSASWGVGNGVEEGGEEGGGAAGGKGVEGEKDGDEEGRGEGVEPRNRGMGLGGGEAELVVEQGIEMEDLEAALEGFAAESLRGAGLFQSGVQWGDVGGLRGVRAELREILEVRWGVRGDGDAGGRRGAE